MKKPLTLILRPEPEATRFATQLRARGHAPLVTPLLSVAPVAHTLPQGDFTGILITSRHALPAIRALTHLHCYVVGEATAHQAEAMGFCTTSAPTLQALREYLPEGKLLYPRGRDISQEPAVNAEEVITYAALAATALPAPARAALEEGCVHAIPLFSPRSARIFASLIEPDWVRNTRAFALSPAVAEAARALPWKSIHTSTAPHAEALAEAMDILPRPE